ncbi:M12 family metallo-peptidase [Nitrospira sp. M1]
MYTRRNCIVAILGLCMFFLATLTYADDTAPPLTEDKSFEILYYESLPPMAIESREPDSSDPDHTDHTWNWSFEAFGRTFDVVLESNNRLIDKLSKAQKERLIKTNTLYRGTIQGIEHSWVRLTKMGKHWSGMFWDGQEVFIIDSMQAMTSALSVQPSSDSSTHGIYRLSDTRDLGVATCGLGTPGRPAKPMTDYSALLEELKGFVPAQAAGASFNLDMAIVSDPQFAQIQQDNFGTSADAAVLARLNVVDGIFSEQVGVQIHLVEIRHLAQNGTLTSTNPSTLLDQFGNFTSGSTFTHPGIAHLFTGRDLNGSTIGIAFLSSLCSSRFGVGVDQIRGGGTAGALVVAHELGHNFGAPHDNQGGSACASTPGNFLMNPSINGSDQFSQCSLNQMQPVVDRAACISVVDLSVPTVGITSPMDGAFITSGSAVTLVGTATDEQDGNLNSDLVWRSDRDGQVGTGGRVSTPLSVGTHRITASVTDSSGGTATQRITIAVTGNNPGGIFLNSNFNSGTNQYTFVDDPFRNTNQPNFASGAHAPGQGFSGGALRVQLGGINNSTVRNMSGGWRRTFTLPTESHVTLLFRYKLTQGAEYESDEISQALLSVDNQLRGDGSNDFLARIAGNGNGGDAQSTDWVPVALSIGTLPAGSHTITIGGFNNKKTFNDESTEVSNKFITVSNRLITVSDGKLTIRLTRQSGTAKTMLNYVRISPAGGSTPPPPPPPPGQPIISASFDAGTNGFTYMDDTFRNTNQPNFAKGAYQPNFGFTGGGLQVLVGGHSKAEKRNMSGGWRRSFNLPTARPIKISLRYRMGQTSNYEPDEFSETLLSIDNTLIGPGGSQVLARITGDGDGGSNQVTGWVAVTLNSKTLSQGTHTITIGGFNNKKDAVDEITQVLIDDVVIR